MGHSVDYFLSGKTDTGMDWLTSGYVSREESKAIQKEFTSLLSGEWGEFTNGDGKFVKGNFINAYEGRVYGREAKGEQWWAENNARYSEYLRIKNGISEETRKSRINMLNQDVERYEQQIAMYKKKKDSESVKETKALLTDAKKELKRIEKIPLEKFKTQEALMWSEWGTAKTMYPELTKFIETFYGRI